MAQLALGRQRRRFHVGCFAIPSVSRHASMLGAQRYLEQAQVSKRVAVVYLLSTRPRLRIAIARKKYWSSLTRLRLR